MPKKLKWDDFNKSKEYVIWEDLERICKEFNISEKTFTNERNDMNPDIEDQDPDEMKDLGGIFWEPLLDRILKLAIGLKCNAKLKDIKIDWIRPIMYFGSQNDGEIRYDKRKDVVEKEAVGKCTLVRYALQRLIKEIRNFPDLKENTFNELFKSMKKELKEFCSSLVVFRDLGYRVMHEHIKLLLKPLRELRKAGYRLFTLEKTEANYRHLTVFKNKNDINQLQANIKEFFQWEQWKMKRDTNIDELKKYLEKPSEPSLLEYTFRPEQIQQENNSNLYETQEWKTSDNKKKKLKDEEKELLNLIFPNINEVNKQPEPSRFRREAYQLQFEKGLESMIKYLNERQPKIITHVIDTHKIFINLKFIPNGLKDEAPKFYLEKLQLNIDKLKLKCYEMKVNGLARVKLPIYLNTEFVDLIKNIFKLQVIIDFTMGDFLLYEQYMFIYNKVKFLTESTLKDEIEKIKKPKFMDEGLPRYVFFESLCHSVNTLNNMINDAREKGEYFKAENYYQILKHELEGAENQVFYNYDKEVIKTAKPEILKEKEIYDNEIKLFGRYWLMEGFFPIEDRELWIETIEMLRNINEVVREDIRDYILMSYLEDKKKEEKDRDSKQRKTANQGVNKPLTKKAPTKKFSRQNSRSFKRRTGRLRTDSFSSYDDSMEQQGKNIPEKLDGLRPPKVWNFPINNVRNIIKETKGGNMKNEIRNVDPTVNYVDKRVEKFYESFEKLFKRAMDYCRDQKANLWNYDIGKILEIFNIHYYSDKAIKTISSKEKEEDESAKQTENNQMPEPQELQEKILENN